MLQAPEAFCAHFVASLSAVRHTYTSHQRWTTLVSWPVKKNDFTVISKVL